MPIVESNIHWKESEFLKKLQVVKRKGNKRWVSKTGDRYFEWDSLLGEIEVYNRRGKAIAILNSDGTLSQKKIEHGRKIDV